MSPCKPPGADPHAGWCGIGAADNGCPYAHFGQGVVIGRW